LLFVYKCIWYDKDVRQAYKHCCLRNGLSIKGKTKDATEQTKIVENRRNKSKHDIPKVYACPLDMEYLISTMII
jgi:hypothetical protein